MKKLELEGVLDLTEENKIAPQQLLQLSIESQEDCPICLDTLKEPVISKCAHTFCTPCLERVIEIQHKCPMCHADLESLDSTTIKPTKEIFDQSGLVQQQPLGQESSISGTSSKVEALSDILKASSRDVTNKTIVFSQWTSFLDLLQPHLALQGLRLARIDGSMLAAQRDSALHAFDSSPEITMMLASLAVCNVGLNFSSEPSYHGRFMMGASDRRLNGGSRA